MSWIKSFRRAVDSTSGAVAGKSSGLFQNNPLAFSALPEPIKKAAYERDAERLAEWQATVNGKRADVDGLRAQLEDLRARAPSEQATAFGSTNSADYQKYLMR